MIEQISHAPRRQAPAKRPPLSLSGLWHSLAVRSWAYQIAVVAAVIGMAVYMVGNAQDAMERRGIATGFGFLGEEAGFDIGESLIAFNSENSFLRAYGVAVLNTLKVSVFSILFATLIGVVLGIARLSSNVLVAKLSAAYVEIFRNTPQLVQIIFWYTLITQLPAPKQAFSLFDAVFLTNRGLILPWPEADPVYLWTALALVCACGAAVLLLRWADRLRRRTGRRVRVVWWNLGLILAAPLLVWSLGGAPTAVSIPYLKGFNFTGGLAVSPEFLALLLGLSLYIAAFIAEIVRSGIQSVGKGQIEASRSICLRPSDTYRKVILPQALRVIVPPTAAQYVSLVKNSSLGVAIGYPELFNVNNTIVTLSGHTTEAIAMMMAIYLSISFSIAVVMNLYNRAVQIKER
ncbi:amino acid ABC transporter permease [Pelagibius sp.]|uniref:amino acid ABC transporter permease n=1 Tax=Pelagibius sp. TaxID=1931238 RepID=UPI00263129F2|nr:ABC transporter permease subunit [Pelagibius sp.]